MLKKIIFLILLSFTFTSTYSSNATNNYGQENAMQAIIKTTKGEIIINLEYKKTPMTVANFVGLAEGLIKNDAKPIGEPYYNGIKFHRVISDFMIQGGDPDGTGRGGPGYNFPDEFHPDLKHDRAGVLSMANAGPGTNGSQFFITHRETPWLDGKHSVFGYVVSGQDIVNNIEQDDIIESVTITKKGDALTFDAPQIFKDGIEKAKKEAEKQKIEQEKELEKLFGESLQTESGLRYIILKEGSGDKPKPGNHVNVHYTGYLLDGTKFDSSVDRNQPFHFQLGVGQVIKGWDEGIALLSVGTKAKFIIPSNLAYGTRGAGGVIPPNATLVFEVELLEIHDGGHHHH